MRDLFALAVAALAALACACQPREPFVCASSDQCVSGGARGTCEPTGFCSFDDPACDGGRRYEPNAGDDLAGTCLPAAPVPPAPEVCGAVSQTCCKAGAACSSNGRCSSGTCASCVIDASFGRHHACLVKHDGTVWCAGENAAGQLGFGIAGTPVPTWTQARDSTSAVIGDATAISSGQEHSCALRAGGTVWCWGGGFGNAAVQVQKLDGTPLTGIIEIRAGSGFRCGRDGNGGVWCLGAGGAGQLGDGGTTTRTKAAPVLDAVGGPPLTGAVSLSVGSSHACIRKADDSIWCWGSNGSARIGDGTTTNVLLPKQIATGLSVAAGKHHTCTVHLDGTVWCAGESWRNRIGNGVGSYDTPAPGTYPTPVQVVTTRGGPPFANAAQVFAGGLSCALVDKAAYCWGDNLYGQIGTGAGTSTPAPVLTTDGKPLTGVERIDAYGPHACAFRDDGEILCWGRGIDGEFGDGTFNNRGLATPLGFSCQ